MIELRRYVTQSGVDVVGAWLDTLRDHRTRAKIIARLTRLSLGNHGDCKPIRDGVWDLRIDWGPRYRVYYAMAGKELVLLLCGGDKRTQSRDIAKAIQYWNDYQRRTRRHDKDESKHLA
jgi:putative addiction module killer protein